MFVTTARATTFTVTPTADATVSLGEPNTNYGATSTLSEAYAQYHAYLQFQLPALDGPIQSATLRLYSDSTTGSGYGILVHPTDNTWTESGITWHNAPGMGPISANSHFVTASAWTSLDVTGITPSSGAVSFGLTSNGSIDQDSREAGSATAPQLVIQTAPTPPTASITSGPGNGSTQSTSSASFGFTSNQSGSTFRCSLDGAAYSACTSPQPYSGLANGSHTFSVEAVNNGLTSSPASSTWKVAVPPTASITSGPSNGSTQTSGSVSFGFTSNQSGSTFQCSLDGASYSTCSSPQPYSGLAGGSHTFSVEALNNGLTSSPVSATWTVSTASSCPVPYTSNSPWNTPIGANPTVDPNSGSEVSTLTTNTSYPKLGSDPTQYTYPVYYATSSTPTVPVWVDQLYSNVTGPNTLQKSTSGTELQLPIPTDAIPANGSDGQIIVLDQSTGDEWGFWQVYNSTDPVTSTVPAGVGTSSNPLAVQNSYADYWVGQQITIGQGTANVETAVIASFPDASHMVLTKPTTKPHNAGDKVWAIGATNGYHYNTEWSGIPPSGFTSRGAGVPYLTGLVRPCEITQGHVDHALAFAYQNTTSQFVSPATKSDGGSSSGMPEGTHLQLDPSISDATIQSWGCTGACFTTAKALQKYGMYLIDSGGHPKVMFEDDSTANWNGTVSASTTNPIPLSAFRVIDG